jgi:hypothetical protein
VDLENLLANNDPDKTSQAAVIEDIASQSGEDSQGQVVADPNDVQATDALTGLLRKPCQKAGSAGVHKVTLM